MKFILVFSMVLSTLFSRGSHPIGLMTIILAQTMVLCLMIWLATKMNWFSFILFLIFLGGLMVLFIYISSLASNEMFSISHKTTFIVMLVVALIVSILTFNFNNQLVSQKTSDSMSSLLMLYSKTMIMPSLTVMIYLLLTLIIVVKVTSKYEGPLRSTIFNK